MSSTWVCRITNWVFNFVHCMIMGFELERAGDILYLNWNSFDSKWAVVLLGQFARTFARPNIYCHSFILVVILLIVLLSVCISTAGIGCHRVQSVH